MKKHLIHVALFVGLSALGVVQAQAAAGDLAKCYDKVIAACNKTNHAESCAENGMNQCDEIHPTPFVVKPNFNFAAPTRN